MGWNLTSLANSELQVCRDRLNLFEEEVFEDGYFCKLQGVTEGKSEYLTDSICIGSYVDFTGIRKYAGLRFNQDKSGGILILVSEKGSRGSDDLLLDEGRFLISNVKKDLGTTGKTFKREMDLDRKNLTLTNTNYTRKGSIFKRWETSFSGDYNCRSLEN